MEVLSSENIIETTSKDKSVLDLSYKEAKSFFMKEKLIVVLTFRHISILNHYLKMLMII